MTSKIFIGIIIALMLSETPIKEWQWDFIGEGPDQSQRSGHSLTYHDILKQTVLFGGFGYPITYDNNLYGWQNYNWNVLDSEPAPVGRYHHSMAYDKKRQQLVLFGGINTNGESLNDTWVWDYKTGWQQIFSNTFPPPTYGHSMIYHDEADCIIIFGGIVNGTETNQMWQWNGYVWRQIIVNHSPISRFYSNMSYDNNQNTIILYGGTTGIIGEIGDVWQVK